jgi:hypothetical protein
MENNNVLEAEVLSVGLSEREERSAASAALRAARIEGVGTYDVLLFNKGAASTVTVKVTASK